MKVKLACVTVGLLLLASSAAMAGPPSYPPECDAGVRQGFYDGGWEKAQWWWDRVICPDINYCEANCPKLLASLTKIIALEEPQDDNAACEFGGFASHLGYLFEALNCDGETCCDTGEDMGEIFAHTYCILALTGFVNDPGDWFRPPVVGCGFWYEWCCDREFDFYTYWYPNDDLTTPNDECRPYVAGNPWGDIHDNVREMTCQYTGP
jgi:hypothetical protein